MQRMTPFQPTARNAIAMVVCSLASCTGYRPSALCQELVSGDFERAIELIEAGADVNASYGCALTAAASRGELQIAELLLDHGANPNRTVFGDVAVIMGGSTPLVSAIQSGDIRMVRLLLDRGASPVDDFEAFQIVINFSDVEMAELLLSHGANPNNTHGADGPAYAMVYTRVGDRTEGRQVEVPQRDLAPARIDDTARRWECDISDAWSVLHEAIGPGGVGNQEERNQIVRLLLERGADPNGASLRNGTTPLMHAASLQNHAAVVMLMDAGADVQAVDRCARTAKDYADLYPERAALASQTKLLLDRRP